MTTRPIVSNYSFKRRPATSPAHHPNLPRHPLSIVVVKSNDFAPTPIVDLIQDSWFKEVRVRVAESIEEAMSRYSSSPVDLIVLDLGVVSRQAKVIIQMALQAVAELPVLSLCSEPEVELVQEMLQDGIQSLLLNHA